MFLQGLDEEGLYRISGPVNAIDELKDEFEKSMLSHIYCICIICRSLFSDKQLHELTLV